MKKVLVIEDDAALVKALSTYFNRRGLMVVSAGDGLEALQTFAREKPELVLADIGLPGMDGLEVIRQIKQSGSSVATILMTGNPQSESAIRGLRLGAVDFLTKPFTLKDLDESMNTALSHQSESNKDQNALLQQMVQEKDATLRETQKELTQSAKMSALGELTAGLTHEINQPLTALKLTGQEMLYALRHDELQAEDIEKSVEEMLGHIETVIDIVKHMRTFAHADDDNTREWLDVNHVVRDVLNLTHRQFRSQNITVRLDLDPGLPACQLQRVKLEQVLMNLLSNARDALIPMQDKQRVISITSRLTHTASGDVSIVRVQDNGTGIPADVQKKIFQPFFTTKGSSQGTGLGLSISKRIVESMGGTISFETELNQGTTFQISLPNQQSMDAEAA